MNGITWRWAVGLTIAALCGVLSLVFALGAYTFTTTVTALDSRLKALEDRQLPSVERMVNLEGVVKTIDVKMDNLSTEVGKLNTQIQLDRQARQSGGSK